MSRRFLVIGSNSFSGAYFVKYLLDGGNTVLGVSRSEQAHKVLLPYQWQPSEGHLTFHQIDLNHQLDELIDLIKVCKSQSSLSILLHKVWLRRAG
jgi:dTDP-glucose 4,6-dehydratase